MTVLYVQLNWILYFKLNPLFQTAMLSCDGMVLASLQDPQEIYIQVLRSFTSNIVDISGMLQVCASVWTEIVVL